MSSTGKQIADKIRTHSTSISSQIADIDYRIRAAERAIDAQTGVREDCLIKLADHWLGGEEGKRIGDRLHTIGARLQGIYKARADRRRLLDEQISQLTTQESEVEAQVAAAKAEVDKLKEQDVAIHQQVTEALSNDAGYNALYDTEQQMDKRMLELSQRIGEVNDEIDPQLAAFEDDPLFMYLHNRGFGTDAYDKGWFPKGDRWLAKLIGYEDNRTRYEVLQAIPARLEAERDAAMHQAAVAQEKRDDMLVSAQRHYNLPGIEQLLKVARTTLASRQDQLAANREAQETLRAEKDAIDGAKDPFAKQAKTEMKSFLSGQSIAQLWDKALSTEGDKDDKLVKEAQRAEDLINEQRKVAKDLLEQRRALDDKLSKVKAIETRFSREDYDGRNARYDNGLDIDSLMIGYLAGSVSDNTLWRTVDNSHSTYQEPVSSYSSSSSGGSSSSWSSSSWSSSSDSYSSSSSSYDSGGSSSFDSGSCDSGGGGSFD